MGRRYYQMWKTRDKLSVIDAAAGTKPEARQVLRIQDGKLVRNCGSLHRTEWAFRWRRIMRLVFGYRER